MAITIKDVAARCGLSVSTVSKAFNHYCDISEHTREMVQRTAREMGYFPNAIARALKAVSYTHLDVYKRQAVDSAKEVLVMFFRPRS